LVPTRFGLIFWAKMFDEKAVIKQKVNMKEVSFILFQVSGFLNCV